MTYKTNVLLFFFQVSKKCPVVVFQMYTLRMGMYVDVTIKTIQCGSFISNLFLLCLLSL